MKNYLNFTLTGSKLLPIWLLFLALFVAPYAGFIYYLQQLKVHQTTPPSPMTMALLIPLIIIALAIQFFIYKLSIQSITFKETALEFKASFWTFLGKIILGTFLSIITLGAYLAWFIRDIQKYIINSASLNGNEFKFHGKGWRLFLILFFTIFLPIVLLGIYMAINIKSQIEAGQPINAASQTLLMTVIYKFIGFIAMIPYIYFLYKWMVNISYKAYKITWHTNGWEACGKLALEIALSFITLGIYFPLAMVRLYKYFAEKTFAVGSEQQLRFGYDLDPMQDFLFIWGQTLLTLITLGIYYPWAYSKIGQRILSKTYIQQI